MLQKDYYKILGLDRKASQQEIKKAFRRLAREHHPDANPQGNGRPEVNQRFKDVAEAYEVLGDPERRRQYDQGHVDQSWFTTTSFENIRDIFERTAARQGQQAQPASGSTQKGKFNFGDFLNNIVDTVSASPGKDAVKEPTKESGKENKTKSKAPAKLDLDQVLEITLEEAWSGSRKPVTVNLSKACVLCGGSGKVSGQACRNCQGSGRSAQEKRLDVKVPAGVRKGAKIRVPGEGLKQGNQQGHLYLQIELLEHPFYDADEHGDIRCEVPVSLTEAVLGAELEVPTLGGRVKMKIPPGTQPGQIFRLRGKGMKHPKGLDPGDQYVSVQVVIPKHLNHREQELYREAARSGDELRRHLGA
ncbi:MAG: hypothetical protein CVV27_03980 [Candidatus Melainabacteria bacterium HGW-Melainabacteria-1]|nr:MAG: hypothetical protein CVV27_03980 [Candidatus Melainabacteria bacterium HGW-Melainabacteria-1]